MKSNIDTSIWNDPDFLDLSYGAKYLLLFIFTHPNNNILGVFKFSSVDASLRLGMSESVVSASFKELIDAKYIKQGWHGEQDKFPHIRIISNYYHRYLSKYPNIIKAKDKIMESIPNSIKSDILNEEDTSPAIFPVTAQPTEKQKKFVEEQRRILGKDFDEMYPKNPDGSPVYPEI